MENSICVIMSTYNGERYLREQIESILNQKDVFLELIVRDDGSTDSTVSILKGFAQEYSNIHLIIDRNVGCKESFYEASKYAFEHFPEIEYFAFSDQDDKWLENKLKAGIEHLNGLVETPKLYFCPPTLVDRNLYPLSISWPTNHHLSVGESLILEYAAGCTMVYDRKALELFIQANPKLMSLHDNWILKAVLVCGGRVIEDSKSHILYRQHGHNVVGGIQSRKSIWVRRLHSLKNAPRLRSTVINGLAITYAKYMKGDRKDIIQKLNGYTNKGWLNKIKIITDRRIRTNNRKNNILFALAVIFNRF